MTETQSSLLQGIGEYLLPELDRRGFHVIPLLPDERGTEVENAFPFGRHRRLGPNGVEMIEIQLDKRGHPAFRLNIGVVAAQGVDHPVAGWIPQEAVWVHHLNDYFVLYDRRLFWRWFTVPRRSGNVAYDVRALVARVVAMLPEIDAVLKTGETGPHIRHIGAR